MILKWSVILIDSGRMLNCWLVLIYLCLYTNNMIHDPMCCSRLCWLLLEVHLHEMPFHLWHGLNHSFWSVENRLHIMVMIDVIDFLLQFWHSALHLLWSINKPRFIFLDVFSFFAIVSLHLLILKRSSRLMYSTRFTFLATTLTGGHFLVTALVGAVSNATGYSTSKHVPPWELLWFSIVANMSVTGLNLSLMLNSVGFYQVC